MSSLGEERLTRRCVLRRALQSGTSLVLLGTLPLLESCSGESVAPGLHIPLAELPVEGRMVVMDGEVPIEIIRSGDEVQARSLICTHQGCQVQWDQGENRYLCPCHDGVFDAMGRPILGPPEAPLREYTIRRDGSFVIVDTRVSVEP